MTLRQNFSRVGMYAWAGPGTIRLLQIKYHRPHIDTESFLSAYDLPYLLRMRNLFGITDAFVTYSWGFCDKTEQEDYQFLRQRLSNFKKAGIRTHAYVQGLNLVTADFKNEDVWCKDAWGKRIPYSKGRSFTCPNNPQAISILSDRVKKACEENVDGVFVDNILFGLPPFIVYDQFFPAFGCACRYCQEKFETQFGYPLPLREKKGSECEEFLQFRAKSIRGLIEKLADICKKAKKSFGLNFYDPTLRNDTFYYGYNTQELATLVDYILIENDSLPSQPHKNNDHLRFLLESSSTPVFVVSYKEGIGFDAQYSQKDIDAIFTESKKMGYTPCLKTTEFITNGKWHMLYLKGMRQPAPYALRPSAPIASVPLKKSTPISRYVVRVVQPFFTTATYFLYENSWIYQLLTRSGVYASQKNKPRLYQLPYAS